MGVKGLWQLIEPTGKPVTLESLEGKVLAVGILFKSSGRNESRSQALMFMAFPMMVLGESEAEAENH